MTKFEELCAAYGQLKQQYEANRRECMAAVGALWNGLREYLGAPEGMVSLYARSGSWAGRKVDGPASAMNLADDTFWHFGVALDINEETGQMPFHTIGFELRLKKIGAKFILQVEQGPQFELAGEGPERFLPLFDYIFQFVKGRYQNAFSDFLLKGDPTRRFGF
jgi:hypothetical protein